MYKQAAFMGLRIPTVKGLLTVEQACTLKFTEIGESLKNLSVTLNKANNTGLEFLEETSTLNPKDELAFNILKDIYLTKKEENKAARTAKENKEFEQKILAIIADKKEDSLKGLTIEQLEALLAGKK